MEPQTIGVQVKINDKAISDIGGIIRHEEDTIILRSEKSKLELRFNYVPMLEFLYKVEKERKKIKMKEL